MQSFGNVKKTARAGFSLLELLIAIMILALIMAAATVGYRKIFEGQKRNVTMQSLGAVKSAIGFFELNMGKYPESLEDLIRRPEPSPYYEQESLSNWSEGGYLEKSKVPADAWGNKLQYELTQGEGAAHPYELYSYGSSEGKRAPKEKRISVWDK